MQDQVIPITDDRLAQAGKNLHDLDAGQRDVELSKLREELRELRKHPIPNPLEKKRHRRKSSKKHRVIKISHIDGSDNVYQQYVKYVESKHQVHIISGNGLMHRLDKSDLTLFGWIRFWIKYHKLLG